MICFLYPELPKTPVLSNPFGFSPVFLAHVHALQALGIYFCKLSLTIYLIGYLLHFIQHAK